MLLRQMLYRCDIQFLPIIAGFWMHLSTRPNYEDLIRLLCERMLDPGTLQKMLNGSESRDLTSGLRQMIAANGEIPAETFEETFGPLRVAGIEKIRREKLWQNPVSATEKLWYRGLIFRENRFVSGELKECYILPDDLSAALQRFLSGEAIFPTTREPLAVRPAIPSETRSVIPAENRIPDLFCIAAALRRSELPLEIPGIELSSAYSGFLNMLLSDGGFFTAEGTTDSKKIREFLIQNRAAARIQLIRIWRNALNYDELSENSEEITTIVQPDYDKRVPRGTVLRYLKELSPDTWWSLSGFIAAIKKEDPQFLRKAFSENRGQLSDPDGNDLSGMGAWFQLEGAYLRFLILKPLYWLGITQIAYADKDNTEPAAFRISREALFYLEESEADKTAPGILSKPNLEQAQPIISADGSVRCSCSVPRYFRYMAARCCEIEKFKGDVCSFRLTPNSLAGAERQGLTRDAILSLLRRFSGNSLPPSLERLLAASGKNALPATIYQATILTVPSSDILNDLLETRRLEKYLLQQINSNSVVIATKGIEEIRRFLMEREIFVDIQL